MQNYVSGNYSGDRHCPVMSIRTRRENGDTISLLIGEPKTLATEYTPLSAV
jgi:hypothetical protein